MILLVPATGGTDNGDIEEARQHARALPPEALYVKIRREPWSPVFVLSLSNGHTEEVDCGPESYEWFRQRGADMHVVEKALDYAYNFYNADLVITSPKSPLAPNERLKPKL